MIHAACGEIESLEFCHYRGSKELFQGMKTISHHLFVVEHLMPGESGIDVIKKMRSMDPSSPIIFFTKLRLRTSIEKAFRFGASDCIVTPLSGEVLKEIISKRVQTALQIKDSKTQEAADKNR